MFGHELLFCCFYKQFFVFLILEVYATSADPTLRQGPSVHPRAEHDAAAQHGAGARAAPHGGAGNKQRASRSFLAYLGLRSAGIAILAVSRACTSHFAALACVKCVEEARMTSLVGRWRFHMLFARVCGPPRTLPGASGASTLGSEARL